MSQARAVDHALEVADVRVFPSCNDDEVAGAGEGVGAGRLGEGGVPADEHGEGAGSAAVERQLVAVDEEMPLTIEAVGLAIRPQQAAVGVDDQGAVGDDAVGGSGLGVADDEHDLQLDGEIAQPVYRRCLRRRGSETEEGLAALIAGQGQLRRCDQLGLGGLRLSGQALDGREVGVDR